MSKEWLSSAEAARRLGVSSATLYAYVSRGLLRSEGTNGQRERRYSADDVTLLKRRRDVGRKAESIAANALDPPQATRVRTDLWELVTGSAADDAARVA